MRFHTPFFPAQHCAFRRKLGVSIFVILSMQVLLYDPLYVWTVSPLKAQQLQKQADIDASELCTANITSTTADVLDEVHIKFGAAADDDSKNKMAERVLIRLKQKLSGHEAGGFLGIEGQVNYLIQEARSSANLCRLFPGWQPWL